MGFYNSQLFAIAYVCYLKGHESMGFSDICHMSAIWRIMRVWDF